MVFDSIVRRSEGGAGIGGVLVSERALVVCFWLPAILVVLNTPAPCPAHARELAYVANSGSDTISVIDTEKPAVVQTIAVGNGLRPVAVAVSPDGKSAYVTNYSGTVTIIDTATNALRASIPVSGVVSLGGIPGQLLPSPDGRLLYVRSGDSAEGYVAVIDLKSQLFANAIPVAPGVLALSPDGRTLYSLTVYSSPSGTLSVVDTASAAILTQVQVGDLPQDSASTTALALSPDGTWALVSFSCSCWPTPGMTCTPRVVIIDTAAAKVVATVDLSTVQASADVLAFAPSGRVAYVGGQSCDSVTGDSHPVLSVFDLAAREVTTTDLQSAPQALAVSPDGGSVYVAEASYIEQTGSALEALEAVDTATDTIRARVAAPTVTFDVPVGLALSPDGGTAYLAAYKRLYVIDTADLEVSATISGAAPSGLVLSPDKGTLYVANAFSGTVSMLDTVTGAVAHTVRVGPTASVVTAAADGSSVFALSGCPDEGSCCLSQQDCSPTSDISVLDPVTNVVKGDMRVPGAINDIAASPDGRLLYAVGCTDTQWCASGVLTAFEAASGSTAGSVQIPGQPWVLVLSPDASTAYVGSSGSVSLVDTAHMSIKETFTTASQVQSLALSRDASALYLTESFYGYGYGGLVSAMEVPAGTNTLNLPVDGAKALALTADGASAYVSVDTGYAGFVSVVDVVARRESARIPVGESPGAMVMGSAPGDGSAGASASGGGGCAIHAHAGRCRLAMLLCLIPLLARLRRRSARVLGSAA
jgi:YVTN family beta-propeller protein